MNIYRELDPLTLQKFREYHLANRWIYQAFKEAAFEMKSTGRKRYSAKAIMEFVRWNYDIENPGKEFKISNSYTAYYARLLAHKHPEFEDFFQFKTIKGLKAA